MPQMAHIRPLVPENAFLSHSSPNPVIGMRDYSLLILRSAHTVIREFLAEPGEHQNVPLKIDEANSDVRVFVAIRAERRRILNTLTAPEYMDVWLTMPGIERLECRPEQNSFGGFRIDASGAGTPPMTIYGSCIRTRPDEISYLWEKARNGNVEKSVVKMRLKSGPRRCSLHLVHAGLWTQQECQWYSIMWRGS